MIRLASAKVFILTLWMHSVFRIEKKFSAKALSYGLPRLDMDGIIPYCCSAYHCVLTRYALCGSRRCCGIQSGTFEFAQPEADPLPVCPCDWHKQYPLCSTSIFLHRGSFVYCPFLLVRFNRCAVSFSYSFFRCYAHFSAILSISWMLMP